MGLTLDETHDAFGSLLAEALDQPAAIEVVERDDGFIAAAPCQQYFAPFRLWPARQRRSMRFVRGRVLDVGSGSGRVALHLQERGHEVVAIDVSPGAVEVARRRGVKDARLMSLADVARSRGMGSFDTILMLGNNFGLFESEREAPRLLRQLRNVSIGRGRLLAESRDPYATADPEDLTYCARNGERGRMGGQARLRVRHRHRASPWFDYLFVSREELRCLADRGGWRVVRFIPETGPRYIAVLELQASSPTTSVRPRRRP
jgi:SAM-dependent methyltransferase